MKTSSFQNLTLEGDTASGNSRYQLDRFPETRPASSVFDRLDVVYRQTADLHGEVSGTRRQAHLIELESRMAERARSAPVQALEQLADLGFAWRDVARVVGVSVPAITKWRRGTGITGENRLKIARLLGLVDMLTHRLIGEPASWLEMPIREGVGLTHMDLLERGRYDLVIALASTHTGDGTIESVLNEIDPDWRDTLVDHNFETYVADDGAKSIRLKR